MRTAPAKRARRRKSAGTPDYQLPLPLFEHGLQAAHQHPLVGDLDKHTRGRRPAAEAWRDWHYIEANPPHAYAAMVFDIDDPVRWEYETNGPVPNWQVRKDSSPATYHVCLYAGNPGRPPRRIQNSPAQALPPRPRRPGIPVRRRPAVQRAAHQEPTQPSTRMHHPVPSPQSVHPCRTQRMGKNRHPAQCPHHRRRPQRGPVPRVHQARPPTPLGRDHPSRRILDPMASTRPLAEHHILRREPTTGFRVPIHRQELRQIQHRAVQRRNVQRHPDRPQHKTLAPWPTKLRLPQQSRNSAPVIQPRTLQEVASRKIRRVRRDHRPRPGENSEGPANPHPMTIPKSPRRRELSSHNRIYAGSGGTLGAGEGLG